MSKIQIDRDHSLGVEGARDKIAAIETDLKQKYGVTLRWRGNDADISGSGVSGSVVVQAERLSMKLKLGLLLRPVARKIQAAIEKSLDKALSEP